MDNAETVFSAKERQILDEIIQNNRVNLSLLRTFCYQDNLVRLPRLRPMFWRVLLGFWPLDAGSWAETSKLNKSLYESYVSELFIRNDENQLNCLESPSNSEKSIEFFIADHPLNQRRESNWQTHFKNKELWSTIEKDTRRTRSEEGFFSQLVGRKYPSLSVSEDLRPSEEPRKDVLTRILFVFAKTHPNIRYVQGMNEILAPIYYCFAGEEASRETLEEDSFTCFSLLMSEIKENFTKIKDCSLLGFKARINKLDKLLKKVDPKLWAHLRRFQIMTEIYSTRWILLLLTQDFDLASIMRIWDVLFSFQDRQEFVNFLSLAMILVSREEIMKESLEEIHSALRRTSKVKVESILEKADSLAREYKEILA